MSPSYQFTFVTLPFLHFSDPTATRRSLLQAGFIQKIWTHVCIHLEEPALSPPRVETFGEVLLVLMPAPIQSPEAYFVAIVGEEPRLYTLELGQDLDTSQPCTFFCATTPSGRANYGQGPKPEVSAFLAALAGFR